MKTKAVLPQVSKKIRSWPVKTFSPQRQDGAFFYVNKTHILPCVLN